MSLSQSKIYKPYDVFEAEDGFYYLLKSGAKIGPLATKDAAEHNSTKAEAQEY